MAYIFNVTDYDEDVLFPDISPKDPFFHSPSTVDWLGGPNMVITANVSIFSVELDKTHAGGLNNGNLIYPENISVSDGQYVDSKLMYIDVIEINNAPNITNIGAKTVYTQGDNSTFYHETQATDVEYDQYGYGILNYSVDFEGAIVLFDINTSTGIVNFTPFGPSQIGVYNVSVCVEDTEITNPHVNISLVCGQDGSSMTTCNNFSLTVTNDNRPPTIIDYYPQNLSFNASGSEELYFNITKYDPDHTVPDAYWYVDGVFQEYDNGLDSINNTDEFSYTFGCGVSEDHIIKAEITDGLLNDSINWTVNVGHVECILPGDEPGGGGGNEPICVPEWVCADWGVCLNAEVSLTAGIISGYDYRVIQDQCVVSGLGEGLCGFQVKNCLDLSKCNSTFNMPDTMQSCYYTSDPSCSDEIKNCHSGACEILVDCGGPCDACPTCSDEIKNQGEEGVDCGGPCPWKCEPAIPFLRRKPVLYTFAAIILLIIAIVVVKLIKILKYKKTISETQNK